MLNSTANPAQFGWKWAGLAVLFNRQLPNGSHDLFHIFSIFFFNWKELSHKILLPSHFWHIILAIGARWCDLRAENNTSFSSKSSEILLFFENHYSHVFFIVYDAFIGAEINLRQKGTVAKISSNRLVILEFSSQI